MATRYNVYASGVDYDADSSGEWVSASDHEEEVNDLEEKIGNLDSEVEDLKATITGLEADKDVLECQLGEQAELVDTLNARIEELERGLLEIINS